MAKARPWLTDRPVANDSRLEPEYKPAYNTWRSDPNPTNASAMLKSLKPVMASGIQAYGGVSDNPMLRSHAKKLTLDALRTYDPAGRPLKNHVLSHLQGLQRYAAKQTQMLSVPERVAIDRQRLDAGVAELTDRTGSAPSSAQLADHLSMPLKQIEYVRGYRPGLAQGQTEAGRGGDEESGGDPAVVSGDPIAAKLAFLYHDLDPINQALIERSFGMHGFRPMTHTKIATALNLSQGAISQRAAKIQTMLDQLDDSGVF